MLESTLSDEDGDGISLFPESRRTRKVSTAGDPTNTNFRVVEE
jgi:hypothetical protein